MMDFLLSNTLRDRVITIIVLGVLLLACGILAFFEKDEN